MLGFGDNPLYQLFDANRGSLQALAFGIGQDPAVMAQLAMQGRALDDRSAQQREEEDRRLQYAETLRSWGEDYEPFAVGVESGAFDVGEGYGQALQYRTSRDQEAQDLQRLQANAQFLPQGPWQQAYSNGAIDFMEAQKWAMGGSEADGPRVSLAGQWGIDEATQQPVYLQPSDTGDFVRAQTPEGVSLLGPYDLNADRAAGSAFGRQVGGAQFDLPNAQLIAEQTISAINDVRNEKAGMSEHFGNVLGVPQQWTPAYPGSEKAQFQVAADRVVNRAFLEGREMLAGGGQITDFESRKAEAAITAAQSALEKGDQAQFLKALDDFEQAVRDGTAKLAQQGAAMPGYGSGPQPAPVGGAGGSDYRTKYGLE